MNDPSSIAMRATLEDRLKAGGHVLVHDGRVAPGEEWAKEIRKRIKNSRLVVADVTGPSKEVLFEVGFAANKAVIQVAESVDHREALPRWMTSVQTAVYSGTGIATLSAEVLRLISSRERVAVLKRPDCVPGVVVWLSGDNTEWANDDKDQFSNLAREIAPL
jgi:hypothetical protein